MSARPLFIFDLDGTLADISHRTHLIDGAIKNWPDFFKACVHDAPIRSVIGLMSKLHGSGCDVQIWSGRSDEVRHETRIWLRDYLPVHLGWHHWTASNLRMRWAGDHRNDDVLKGEWLAQLSSYDRERLAGVFEDRDRVVAMWRAAGVQCYQVAPGEF